MKQSVDTSTIGNGKVIPSFSRLLNKTIICQVWSVPKHQTPKIVGTRKAKYGDNFFHLKIGKEKRMYKINYDPKAGGIKEGKKCFIYDTTFDNTTGALTFDEHMEFNDSRETEVMLEEMSAELYVRKGGLPFLWFMVAIASAVIAIGITGYMSISYVEMSDYVTQANNLLSDRQNIINENTNLKQQVNTLTQQLAQKGSR